MTLLFLGVLLLIIGYFYFGYYTEGFQAASALAPGPINTCQTGTDEQKCNPKCRTGLLPDPTSNEEISYAIYESHNLADVSLTAPPIAAPSSVPAYNMAGSLTPTDLDKSQPLPWDFDNMSLKPADALWGKVDAKTSQLIYKKCEAQALYGDINNLNYDPESGRFSYKSTLFDTTVTDKNQAAAMQFSEMFINLQLGEIMNTMFERTLKMPNEYVKSNAQYYKEANFKLEKQISDYKDAINPTPPTAKRTPGEAARLVGERTKLGYYDDAWAIHSQTTSRFPMSQTEKLPGVDDLKRKGFKILRDSLKKSPLNIDFSNPELALAKLEKLAKDDNFERIKKQRDILENKAATNKVEKEIYRDLKSILASQDNEAKKRSIGTTTIYKRIADFIPFYHTGIMRAAALKKNTMFAIEIAKKALSRAQVQIVIDTILVVTSFIPGLQTISVTIQLLILAIDLACQTFVGPIFASFIDSDAVCPRNTGGSRMWNFNDYFYGNEESVINGVTTGNGSTFLGSDLPTGTVTQIGSNILVAVLTNIPVFGSLFMAFGPYLCFPNMDTIQKDGGKINFKLKNNLRSPPYYYDPTLSLYNAGNKPRFEAGISGLDQRLFNPLTFHYNKNINQPKDAEGALGYPVWVDFANPLILNKMAQFYYDASRKCPTTTIDGMLSFEYISKFMGLVSTTELTCDVQCEITQITFDPESGVKICETVVPIAPGTLSTMYHDRRFYFWKDMTKKTRILDRTIQIDDSNNTALQQLMEDNIDIYTVSGCTNSDGTAPDCMTYDSEGNSTSNPVISLGEPSGIYTPPMVDIGMNRNEIPFDSDCKRQEYFVRYGRIPNPGAESNDSTKNNKARVISNPNIKDAPWVYAYKDESSKYYYPSKNVADDNNIPPAPDSLKTAKYWSIVWTGCNYNDTNCKINSPQGAATILSGTLEGLIGAGFGTGQVVQGYKTVNREVSNSFAAGAQALELAGGLMQTAMNVEFPGQATTLSRQMACNIATMLNANSDVPQYGTYIMNGRVITVQQGFLADQGPFINWAPGYRPTIKYCTQQRLELYDCVNSYAVRRFVNIYHNANPTKSIKKIHNITPTLQTKLTDTEFLRKYDDKDKSLETLLKENPTMFNNTKNATWDVDNSVGMCVYNIDVVDFDPAKFIEKPNPTNINVGLYLQQMKNDVKNAAGKATELPTCAFVPRCKPVGGPNPRNELLPPNIDMTFLTNPTGSDIFRPIYFSINKTEPTWPAPTEPTIVRSPPNHLNCSRIKDTLIRDFNSAHDGVPVFISATDSLSMKTLSGQNMCIFRGKFGSVYNPDTKTTANPTNTESSALQRNITILIDASGRYISDDFPIHYTYTPIPKRSSWFDVPPRVPVLASSTTFARTGCATDPIYNDCSNSALIDILVTQYNEANVDSKILKLLRSFTPVITNTTVCDYDVERLKKITDGSTILHRETIRFFLKANTSTCGYDLDIPRTNNNPDQINSGGSLNLSDTLGILKAPYNAAVKYSSSVQQQFFSALSGYIGYNIPGITNKTTTDTLTAVNALRKSLYTTTHLKSCPSKTCMDYTVISAMINRYNFDAYPSYPPTQNTVRKNSIIRVTKVGTATPTVCQVELYLRSDFFTDFLYKPLPEDTSFYMRNYVFNLLATTVPCTFKVTPFTQDDIKYSRMDISGDAFTLECPPTGVTCPSVIPISSGTLSKLVTNDYDEVMIRCTVSNPTDLVLQLVTNIYNTTPAFTRSGTSYYNTIHKVVRAFNGMPNILEFKVTTKRVYWDRDYSTAYYTGNAGEEEQYAYIIATWPESTAYEVETGYYWKNASGAFVATPIVGTSNVNGNPTTTVINVTGQLVTATVTTIINNVNSVNILTMSSPTLQEIFYPDLTFTATTITKTDADDKQTQVFLPYLANDELIPVDPRQEKRYNCNPVNCSA